MRDVDYNTKQCLLSRGYEIMTGCSAEQFLTMSGWHCSYLCASRVGAEMSLLTEKCVNKCPPESNQKCLFMLLVNFNTDLAKLFNKIATKLGWYPLPPLKSRNSITLHYGILFAFVNFYIFDYYIFYDPIVVNAVNLSHRLFLSNAIQNFIIHSLKWW